MKKNYFKNNFLKISKKFVQMKNLINFTSKKLMKI